MPKGGRQGSPRIAMQDNRGPSRADPEAGHDVSRGHPRAATLGVTPRRLPLPAGAVPRLKIETSWPTEGVGGFAAQTWGAPRPARPAHSSRPAVLCESGPEAGSRRRTRGARCDRPAPAAEGAGLPSQERRHRASRASKGRARPCAARSKTRSSEARAGHVPCVPCPIKRFIRPGPGRPPPGAPLRSALS